MAFLDWSSLDWQTILLLYGVLLVSLVVHEASHALFALLGGDRTAYVGGQVTLNPLPHIQREPLGTVILPLALLISSNGQWCMGFAHAPYDPIWAQRYPKRAALMSAAGPLSNILLALIAFGALKTFVWTGLAEHPTHAYDNPLMILWPIGEWVGNDSVIAGIKMASAFLLLNVLLAFINFTPLPPFDGAGVVEGLFPRSTGRFYQMVRSQFVFMILGLAAVWYLLPKVLWPTLQAISDLL